MKHRRRVLLPPQFAVRLPAADQRRLQVLQAGLHACLEAAAKDSEPELSDRWPDVADLAQWYLLVAAEPLAAGVTVDVDRCMFMLREAAEHGARPSRERVLELQRRWLGSSRWPCFPDDSSPPLL